MRKRRQPKDETPLTLGPDDATAPDPERSPDVTPQETGPAPEAIERAIVEVGSAAARHYDAAHATINLIISGISNTVAGSAARAAGAVASVRNAADKIVGEQRNATSALGVPVVYGPGAVAAELNDPTGLPIVRAVQTLMTADAAPADDPAWVQPTGPSCGWRYERGVWHAFRSDVGTLPDPSTMPNYPASNEGAIVSVPCPADTPLPSSPPPPPVPPAAPALPCGPYTIDQLSLLAGELRVHAPGNAALDMASVWVVWHPPERPGETFAIWFAHTPSEYPPNVVAIVPGRQDFPPDNVTVVGHEENPCPEPDVDPPPPPPTTSPPPPASCPPPAAQACCPPQTINVTVAGPTSPPPPPPLPGTVPPVVPTKPGPPPPPPTEPKKEKPVGVAPDPGGLPAVDWDLPSACGAADAVSEGGQLPADRWTRPGDPPGWMSWIASGATGVGWSIPGIGDIGREVLGAVAGKNDRLTELGVDRVVGGSVFGAIQAFLPGAAVPQPGTGLGLAAKLGLVQTAERLTGAPVSYLYQSTIYAYQYANPQYLPTQPTVDELFLRNKITAGYWECLTRANGNLPNVHSLALNAKATKPIASDVISLRLRSIIPTDEEYVRRMRELGWLDPGHATEQLRLAEFVPPASDLVRFMVREAADEKVVAKYGYDELFDERYAGRIKDWARAQGIPEDVFRYIWRSHWHIPSPTQLYHMLHRLRADRPAVKEWEENAALQGNPGAFAQANPRPPVVTYDDVRTALQVDDVAPGWVENLMAVSYHPLTNTDARRAFEIGFFSREQLKNATKDNGYAEPDAETLTRFFEAERNKRIGASTGVMSPRSILKAYRDGELSRGDAFDLLGATLPDPDVRQYQLGLADTQIRLEVRRMQIAATKKGFVYGEYDGEEAIKRLQQHGVPGDAIPGLMMRFVATRDGHKKEPRIQFICQWYTHRLITREQYFDRLRRLGYSDEDSARISEVCHVDRVVKERAAVAKAAEAQRREARSDLAELRRRVAEQRKALAELEKQRKEAEKKMAEETATE